MTTSLYTIVHHLTAETPAVLIIQISCAWIGLAALWLATRPAGAHPTPRSRASRAILATTFAGMTVAVLVGHALRVAWGLAS